MTKLITYLKQQQQELLASLRNFPGVNTDYTNGKLAAIEAALHFIKTELEA